MQDSKYVGIYEKEMKKVLIFIFGCALLCACNNQAKLEKEAEAKYEQEAKDRALAEQEEWNKIKTLALKAAGVTSSVREERKLAYVKLIQIFPKSEKTAPFSMEMIGKRYSILASSLMSPVWFGIRKALSLGA